MERGSTLWWCGCLVLASAALWLQQSMAHHANVMQANARTAADLRRVAHETAQSAIPHQLHSYLCLIKAKKLLQNATLVNQTLAIQQDALQHEQELAKHTHELIAETQASIDECLAQIQNDTNRSKTAHAKARAYMDDMYDLQVEFNKTCTANFPGGAGATICAIVARFRGLHQQEQDLAVLALQQEEEAFAANMDKEAKQSLEEALQVNKTEYTHDWKDATHVTSALAQAVDQDEVLEDQLVQKAAALMNCSHAEHDRATSAKHRAQQSTLEASEFASVVDLHAKRARLSSLLALCCGALLLLVLVEHLVHIVTHRMTLLHTRIASTTNSGSSRSGGGGTMFWTTNSPWYYPTTASAQKPVSVVAARRASPTGTTAAAASANVPSSDASTVTSSLSGSAPSEESPLIVSIVGSDNEEASSSYVTIDLQSSAAAPNGQPSNVNANRSILSSSTMTSSDGGAFCRHTRVHLNHLVETVLPPWPAKVELTVAVLAVAFSAHLLFFQILPVMHKL